MNIAAIRLQSAHHQISANTMWNNSPFLTAAKTQQDSVLKEIADNMIEQSSQKDVAEFKVKAHDIMLDQLTETDSASNLEEIDVGALKMYLEEYRLMKRSTQWRKEELIEFRDQLASYDERIQKYQDIIDGKPGAETHMTVDEAKRWLACENWDREIFLKKGSEYLNPLYFSDISDTSTASWAFEAVYGKNPFAGKDPSALRIDISAEDIYAEIDKVLKNISGVSNVFDEGIRQIANALEKKGYGEYKYQLYKDANTPVVDTRKSYMTSLWEQLSYYQINRLKNEPLTIVHGDL